MNMLLSFKSTVYNQAVQVMYGMCYNYSSCRSVILPVYIWMQQCILAAACMPCISLGLHIIIRVVANYFTALAICTAFISYYFPCMYIHYEILYRSTDSQFLKGYR